MLNSPISMAIISIWASGAILSGIMQFTSDFNDVGGSTEAFGDFIDAGSNPEELQVDRPASGQASNPMATLVSYGKTAVNTLVFLARAAIWDFPFFEGWGQTVRPILMAIGTVLILSVIVQVAQPLWNVVSSIGSGVSRLFGAFR